MKDFHSLYLVSFVQRPPQQRVGGYSLMNTEGYLEETVYGNNLKQDLTKLSEFVTPGTDTFKRSNAIMLGSDPYENNIDHFVNNRFTPHFTDALYSKRKELKGKMPVTYRSGISRYSPRVHIDNSHSYNLYLTRFKNRLEGNRVPIHVLPQLGKTGANLHFPQGGLQLNKEHTLQHGKTIGRVITPMLRELA
jgi:hypothetical protein